MVEREGEGRPARVAAGVLLVLIGFGLGLGASRLLGGWATLPDHASPDALAVALYREGGRIVVPEGSPLRSRLAVEPAVLKTLPHTLTLPATVEADPARTVRLLPPVTGRVVALDVELGAHAARGQPLVVIDSGDLAQAFVDDDKARSMLALTRQTLAREHGLIAAHAGALRDLEQAQNDVAQADAGFQRAEGRLKEIGAAAELKGRSRLLTMTAPVTGSVTDLAIAPGTVLNDTAVAIMTIANLDTVWVTTGVPERDIAFVAKNQPVEVTLPAYPGKVFRGTVLFLGDLLDPETRRAKVRIAFDNPDGALRPGMSATASFAAAAVPQLFVPTSALLMADDRTSVFVEVTPWIFERRVVEADYLEGTATRIGKGLREGERVIVRGAVLLDD